MSILSMDAGFMAQLWAMNPEGNFANPPKLAGQTILNIKQKDGKVHFDLGDITVISDPNDMYVFEKPDRFVLKEDLKKSR